MGYPEVKIAAWRAGKKLHLLADECGFHRTKISAIIGGYYEPKAEEKKIMSKILKTDENELFPAKSSTPVEAA